MNICFGPVIRGRYITGGHPEFSSDVFGGTNYVGHFKDPILNDITRGNPYVRIIDTAIRAKALHNRDKP